MSEEQSDKLKLNLKATDTNRFKIEAEQPVKQPADQLPQNEETTHIDDLNAQRKVNTGSFKRIDVSGQAPSNTTAVPGMGDGGIKKSETVRLKVVRATPASGASAAGPAASTVKLNLKRPDVPAAPVTPSASATPVAPATTAPATQPPAAAPAQPNTLKLRPTTPAAESSAASTPTTKVPLSATPATSASPAQPKLSIKKEESPAAPKADATAAVQPPSEPAKPALKLGKPKKEAAATVAVEPPATENTAQPEEKKEEPPKPAMKMKGGPYSKDDDVEKYLPQQDDDEPGALEGVAALIAFLGTGFATYQLVMNFLQQIQ